jgi:predicted CXXCH cytochrome family protein
VHGGANRRLLVRPGGDLCLGCHAAQKALLASPWVHSPFAEGDCASCHDPHASPHAAQTLAAGAALCAGCHDASDAQLKAKHAGIAEGARCTSCHDPHAAKAKVRKN